MAYSYTIVDTDQTVTYNNSTQISPPLPGEAFYGQDAQYHGNQPSYQDNGDGTVTDLNTGLMWQQGYYENVTAADGLSLAESATLAGYDDWRMPTVKELYSLIQFSGVRGETKESSTPFIDTQFFDFEYGDDNGYRFIDSQFISATQYVGTTMSGNETWFGVNFADGRIKGYPAENERYVRLVRGNSEYGENDFADNGDGTVSDLATGLEWTKTDSGQGMTWQEALAWAENLELGGHDDWRLPNAKELQSILDYDQAPDATNPADVGPAVDDDFFSLTSFPYGGVDDYGYYWSSTTHVQGTTDDWAAYVAVGPAWGYGQDPITGEYVLLDVHGAGSQRSDPKTGDPDNFPNGHGPQNDVIRIYNYALAVRDSEDENSTIYKLFFDQDYYLNHNSDVAAAVAAGLFSAEEHFDIWGWKEGRDPNAGFDTSFYLQANQDVDAAGMNPLDHFEAYGAAEGRDPSQDWLDIPQENLDEARYYSDYPEVQGAVDLGLLTNGLQHFVLYGQFEGREAFASDGIEIVPPTVDWA